MTKDGFLDAVGKKLTANGFTSDGYNTYFVSADRIICFNVSAYVKYGSKKEYAEIRAYRAITENVQSTGRIMYHSFEDDSFQNVYDKLDEFIAEGIEMNKKCVKKFEQDAIEYESRQNT